MLCDLCCTRFRHKRSRSKTFFRKPGCSIACPRQIIGNNNQNTTSLYLKSKKAGCDTYTPRPEDFFLGSGEFSTADDMLSCESGVEIEIAVRLDVGVCIDQPYQPVGGFIVGIGEKISAHAGQIRLAL